MEEVLNEGGVGVHIPQERVGNLGTAQHSWHTCFPREAWRGRGSPLGTLCGHAPFLRRHLYKSMLYSEHVCPCALEEEWGSKINQPRTPKKCRALGCHGESEGRPRGCRNPGVSALRSEALPIPLLPPPSLALGSPLSSSLPPLPSSSGPYL